MVSNKQTHWLPWIVIGIGLGLVLFQWWDLRRHSSSLVLVRSNVDGREYAVRASSNQQESADTLARVHQRLMTLIAFLNASNGVPAQYRENVLLISQRYTPERTSLAEGVASNDPRVTTYTVNKGEKIVFCLAPRNSPGEGEEQQQHQTGERLYDLNLLTFVALHEMAHIGCRYRDNHGPEFQGVFAMLLKQAEKAGVYRRHDFAANPVNYCGVDITMAPIE